MSQTNDDERQAAASRPNDVIAAVLEDHADIKSMMNDVAVASRNGEKQEAFERLVAKLAVHETAEEEVVHPLAKKEAHAEEVVEQRLDEEHKGKRALADLEKMGTDAPEFDRKFDEVQSEILAHAEREEKDELPRLDRGVDEDKLERAASTFRMAQRMAPTHAHPHGPDSAAGNLVLGPFVAVADRTRDAIRNMMRGPSV